MTPVPWIAALITGADNPRDRRHDRQLFADMIACIGEELVAARVGQRKLISPAILIRRGNSRPQISPVMTVSKPGPDREYRPARIAATISACRSDAAVGRLVVLITMFEASGMPPDRRIPTDR